MRRVFVLVKLREWVGLLIHRLFLGVGADGNFRASAVRAPAGYAGYRSSTSGAGWTEAGVAGLGEHSPCRQN